ncbi:ThuA domain-containing protein [Butyrivibrio sp. MC2013]|uniref:ThuA domain-containing protein n=1 Tax=Butyrivibrio sp. MC2013 TaxID=1280686 RepID=UPI000412F6B6|nr:ThuA domain-containing protein [Butyrivibrio sp. MC2013]
MSELVKILVLCDDIWHPAEVIERGLADLDGKLASFDFVKDPKDILTPDFIKDYPIIMNCKSHNLTSGNSADWFENGVSEVGPAELEEYVREGGAILSVHAGNTYNDDHSPDYAALIGNKFVTHPPRCEVTIYPEGDHPITRGITPFTIRDEHYEIELTGEGHDVFLTSVSESGGRQVAGYTKESRKGRICILTPGHILSVWKDENFRLLLGNAINWCLGSI